MSTVRKAIASFLSGLVIWATAVTMSKPGAVTSSEYVQLLGIAVTSFLVWLVPNAPQLPSRAANGRFMRGEGDGGQANTVLTVLLIIVLAIILVRLLGGS